jgi:hypothetical protein
MAENPDRIRKLFHRQEANKHGIYAVNITKNGHNQQIIVDDQIPCIGGVPKFSKSKLNELWVIILEKAWAKLHGCYQRIQCGEASETLRDLTGAPSFKYRIRDEEEDSLWDKIKKWN